MSIDITFTPDASNFTKNLPAGMMSVDIRQWRLPMPLTQFCLAAMVKVPTYISSSGLMFCLLPCRHAVDIFKCNSADLTLGFILIFGCTRSYCECCYGFPVRYITRPAAYFNSSDLCSVLLGVTVVLDVSCA